MTNYILLSTFSLLICYLLYHFLLRKEQNFQFNRIFLLGSLLGSITLPLLDINLIATDSSLPTQALNIISGASYSFETGAFSKSSMIAAVPYIYWLGTAVFAILLLRQYLTLAYFILRHKKVVKANYILVQTGGSYPTSSFLNYLFWNEKQILDTDESNKIVNHELKHIRDKHSMDVLFVELMRIAFWFNPVIRMYKNAILENHEYIADKAAISENKENEYITLLTRQLLNQFEFTAVSHFNKSLTLNRINMIKSKQKSKYNIRHLFSLFFIICVFGVISCESQVPAFEDSEVFTEVDSKPVVEAGMNAIYAEIAKTMKYPEQARKMGIEGRVFIQFIVNKDGSASDFTVLRGIGAGCDAEALKAAENAMKKYSWTAGIHNGNNVRVQMVLPISFKLSD